MKILLLTMLLSLSHAWGNSQRELTLYFIPSPHGIDWTTPSTLAVTAIKNKISLKPHFMGHVWVDLKCGNQHELTGMTDQNPDYINQVLVQQKGLGVLFHSFQGRLEEKADIEEELTGYFKNGGLNFVTFLLNEGQCKRASQYLSEYRENNVGRYYGLVNRPRHGEGSGCSAFGASFVDVLNLIDQDMRESWSQTVKIPLELAGPPLREEGVSLFKIIFNAGSWAKDGAKSRELTFWDPDRMYKWVERKVSEKHDGVEIKTVQKVKGIVLDKTHFPVPEEAIWLQQLDPKDQKKTAESGSK